MSGVTTEDAPRLVGHLVFILRDRSPVYSFTINSNLILLFAVLLAMIQLSAFAAGRGLPYTFLRVPTLRCWQPVVILIIRVLVVS